MNTKKLGWTDLELSAIGLGTWPLGGSGWKFSYGPQDDRESIATIFRALDKGVNWIDTSPLYGLGHAEEVVGKALKGLSDRPIIATKCGRVWDKDGNISAKLDKASVRAELEASLKRMGIDVIDLYQIHWPEPDNYVEEAWDTLAEMVKEGKIRYAGVSNFSIEQLKRVQPMHPPASLQSAYNMIEPEIEDEILDYCRENSMGVVTYSPLQQGMLTGYITRKRHQNLPEGDHRRDDPRFQEPGFSANLQLVEALEPIAGKIGITLAQLALAWVLRKPQLTSAIVGARRPSQVEETILAADMVLSGEDTDAIDSLVKKRRQAA